ncbi:MAG: hypothetical protein U0441_37595 [Polyangiaceae bacterium]
MRGVSTSVKLALWMVPVVLGSWGCGPAATGETPKAPAAASATSPVSAGKQADPVSQHILPEDVDIEVSVAPVQAPPSVHVRIGARGDGLRVWESEEALALFPQHKIEATDASGPIDVVVESAAGHTKMTLGRAPVGTVWLSYDVAAQARKEGHPPAIGVDPDRFAAAAETMVAIPSGLVDKPVRAILRVESDEVGTSEMTRVATTFGLGARQLVSARGGELRQAYFAAGLMGHGQFDAPEGDDSAAWLGYTAFDPRPGFADMAGLRTALHQMFGAGDAERVTFLFFSDRRPAGSFLVTRRLRSVVSWVSEKEPWSAPLRIAVGTSVVHGWIGGRLWIGPSEPAREQEGYWFSEGVSRALARDLLFRFGLVTPGEAALDVEGLASVLATSPRAKDTNEALRKDPKGAVPVLVARGALYALEVDAKIRAKNHGKRSLNDVLRDLYKQGAAAKGPLPVSAWTDMLAKELGEADKARFHDVIELGKPVDLPDTALGPCFKKVSRNYAGYELGLDLEASMKDEKIRGVVKGGPADRAGLKEGEEMEQFEMYDERPDTKVDVTVVRGGRPLLVSYFPRGKDAKGPGFERKKNVPEDECTP